MFRFLSPFSLILLDEPERREPAEVLVILPASAEVAAVPSAPWPGEACSIPATPAEVPLAPMPDKAFAIEAAAVRPVSEEPLPFTAALAGVVPVLVLDFVTAASAAKAAVPPALVPEDAFPTAAALDALRAEMDAAPQGPDLALREEVAALLGLDPSVAADATAFEALLAALPPPAPEPDPVPEVSPDPVPAWDWAAMSRDWGDLSQGWILG